VSDSGGDIPPLRLVAPGKTPEMFADGITVWVHPFGVTVRLHLNQRDVANVRLSPECAKLLALILKRELKRYEERSKTRIAVPPEIIEQLGFSPTEDW
jgi:hypothetical protein